MGKDKKGINPADAFRREEKKKAIKKAQQQKKEVKEVRSLLNDPTKIDEEIAKYQKLSNESRLDKSLKDKIEELKQMKTIALRKQQIEVIQGKRPRSDLPTTSETVQSLPTSSSQHIPPSFTTNLPVTRRPEESVYYHPTFNPLGFPPPGAPVLYRPTQYLPVPSQPQMLPGGMIPRPVFGMAAPVGWNSGPRGIPPPPPPRPGGAIIGGVNGIPLPPPRPLSNQSLQTQAQAVNPYLLAAQQRKEKKRRREEDDAVVDPLEPAADGYTERFHRNKLGKESHEDANLQNQNHLPMTSSSNYYNSETDITQQNSAQVELEMEEEGKSIEEEQSDDEEDLSEVEDDNESVPASAEPPTTSNSTTTSNPIDFSSFAKFTINKEEIMKRRLQTITDNVVVVALPAKPSEEEGGDEENLVAGPSRPPATSQYVVEDVEEDDDNSENNEEEEVVGPSRPPTNFSSYENYYSMPYPIPEASTTTATRYFTAAEIEEEEEENDEDITPAPATNAKPLLPGFEYYDSDENDEEEEEVSEENADGRKVDSINHFEQPPQIPSTWAINVQRQEEIHGTSAVNTQNSSVSSSDPMIPAKTLKKVKADSALRSLVPNVLKKKIQPPSNDHISRQQQITSSNTETRRSEPATTTMIALIVSKIDEKEDNLLGDFFNEIEGLGE